LDRQFDEKGCPQFWRAVKRKFAVVLFDNPFRDGQAKPRSDPGGFGAEEGLEDTRLQFVRYPAPIIRNFDADRMVVPEVGGSDGNASRVTTFACRIQRVLQNIQ
jgi:hypothetical protein